MISEVLLNYRWYWWFVVSSMIGDLLIASGFQDFLHAYFIARFPKHPKLFQPLV